jgi:lysophospholipase L1-like esterase
VAAGRAVDEATLLEDTDVVVHRADGREAHLLAELAEGGGVPARAVQPFQRLEQGALAVGEVVGGTTAARSDSGHRGGSSGGGPAADVGLVGVSLPAPVRTTGRDPAAAVENPCVGSPRVPLAPRVAVQPRRAAGLPSRGPTREVPVSHRSFVAIGDSFTEGLHDELTADGRHRGWADRVAAALAIHTGPLRYANLAVRGRLLDEAVTEQVPVALRLDPELVSFHAGGNDVLRPRVDLRPLLGRYDEAVATLRASGRTVLVFTALERAGRSGRLADALARRFAAFNTGVRQTAARYGATLVDIGAVGALQDRRLWHEDRLHLAPAGHGRVSAAVLEALGVADPALLGGPPGWWRAPLPALATPRARAVVDDVRWVRHHLLPWVGRRLRGTSSGDAMVCKRPELVEIERAR